MRRCVVEGDSAIEGRDQLPEIAGSNKSRALLFDGNEHAPEIEALPALNPAHINFSDIAVLLDSCL
jgi:hypothetical protein